jgi:hypothetical protein
MTRGRSSGLSLSLCIAAFLCLSLPAHVAAQEAELRGLVRDPSGAVVPGADVTAASIANGYQETQSTDSRGRYVFPSLKPGSYELTVRLRGFQAVRRTDQVLNAGAAIQIDVTLEPEGVTEAIEVGGTAVRDDTPGNGVVLSREFLSGIVLDGRSLQSLIVLAPGVVSMGDGVISADGSRTTSNYVTIDGVSANIGVSRGGPAPPVFIAGPRVGPPGDTDTNAAGANAVLGGFTGGSDVIQLEAIEEVRVQTSAYPAQYGRQPGAQVAFVTRSGTNQFAGSGFDYLRDSRLDAHDWFSNANPAARRLPYTQQQFGGVFGGPIAKDRMFFFFSYEGRQRGNAPSVRQLRVPAADLRNNPALSPELGRLVNAYPLPQGPEFLDALGRPLGAAPFYDASPGDQGSNSYSVKIDRNFGPRLALTGRWNQGLSGRTSFILAQRTSNATDARTLTFNARSVLNTRLYNDWSINYSRNAADNGSTITDRYDVVPIDERALLPDFAPASSSVLISLPGAVQDYRLGPSVANRQVQMNIVDNLSWTAGRHSMRFGVDLRRLTPVYGPTEYRSSVTFNTLSALLNNRADQLSIGSSDQVRIAVIAFSAYAQDTFRATNRLTFDYGMRWEVNPAPKGLDKPLFTLQGFPDLTALKLSPPGTPLYQTHWAEMAPRVGASYRLRPEAAQSTVLRGSFGLYYDLGTGATATAARMFPYNRTVRRPGVPFPPEDRLAQEAPPLSLDPPYTGQDFTVVDLRNSLPKTTQWSAGVDRSFGRSQRLSASYTGHAARRLLRRYFYAFDAVRPVNPAFPGARLNITRNDPGWGDSSDYHALQVQYSRQLSRGLQALANYTLARATDSGSDDATVNLVDNATKPTYYNGYSRFDRRHAASVSAVYVVPTPSVPRFARAVLGGWSTNFNFRAQSAPPLTVTYGYVDPIDTITYTYRVDVVPGQPIWLEDGTAPGHRKLNPAAFALPATALGAGTRNQVNHGNEPRNGVRGFGTWQADFALAKQIRISARRTAQLRAEAQNVFNHPNFSQPDASIGRVIGATGQFIPAPLFGRITGSGGISGGGGVGGSAGGARTIQFALRVNF